jgi:predicted XRE-type DNA-binding protein
MNDEPLQTFASAWDALEDTSEAAASMRRRAELAIAIHDVVERWGQSQAQAAACLGVTQSRLNDLLPGRLDRFSLGALIAPAERSGLAVEMRIGLAAE